MEEKVKNKLRSSLTEALDKWWVDGEPSHIDAQMPWLGDECFSIMAEAALSVIFGMADAEEYMKREGHLSG